MWVGAKMIRALLEIVHQLPLFLVGWVSWFAGLTSQWEGYSGSPVTLPGWNNQSLYADGPLLRIKAPAKWWQGHSTFISLSSSRCPRHLYTTNSRGSCRRMINQGKKEHENGDITQYYSIQTPHFYDPWTRINASVAPHPANQCK